MTTRCGIARRVLPSLVVIALAVAVPHRAPAADGFKPFKLKALEGGERTFADVRGKVTLVVFFFPTCPFCNAAFPEVQRLHDTYKTEGLSTVWINVLPEEERLIAAWRQKHGYTVPVLLGGRSAQRDYNLTMTPTHILVGPRGDVLWRHAGHTPGDERHLEAQIRRALSPAE